jgi:hypothetical protein
LLAAFLASVPAALASDAELPPPVPSEVLSIHGSVPAVPREALSIHGHIPTVPASAAHTTQFGAVTGSTVSNIGTTVPIHTPPAMPAINMPPIR